MIPQTQSYLEAATGVCLREVFASVNPLSCPGFLNFHLHTVFSDGRMDPEDLISQAIALELSHIAITDHHTVGGYRKGQRFLDGFRGGYPAGKFKLPQLWIGVEVNASLLFTEVHILGYNFDPDHSAMQPYLQSKTTAGIDYQAVSAINAIHSAGGLAVLAHPARYRRSPSELIPAAASLGIDGVETYYGYDNSDPWRPSPRQTEQVKCLADSHGLLHTCGTDSHGIRITKRL